MSIYRNMISKLNTANSPGFIAAQLKKPRSFFAGRVAVKMNASNKHLYGRVLNNMCNSDGDKMLEIVLAMVNILLILSTKPVI